MLFSLVVPTYNERQNIEALVRRATAVLAQHTDSFEIIIVDDDSPDGTWQVAEELGRTNCHVKVIRRLGERGLASAVVAGWAAASGEILGCMDGDLQHPPEALAQLLKPIIDKQADITIGSRHVHGGAIKEWGFHRRLISTAVSILAKVIFHGVLPPLSDPMSGYFLCRRSVIRKTPLEPHGYKILLEVMAKGRYQNITEVPIIFKGRQAGRSKAGPKQCLETIAHFHKLLVTTPPRAMNNFSTGVAHVWRRPFANLFSLTRLDVLVLLVVVLIGIIKLPQPFSSDQAMFTFTARNMSEGAVLYRDIWDVKQPGIFYFYLLGGSLFGFNEPGIHFFELLYMIGFSVILIVTLKEYFYQKEMASLTPLFTVGLYYATAGDWHQTQAEALMGAPTYLALWFAFRSMRSSQPRFLWLFGSGLMGGIVLLFKFMFIPILLAFWLTTLIYVLEEKKQAILTTAFEILLPVFVGTALPLIVMIGALHSSEVLQHALWTFFEYPLMALAEWPAAINIHWLIGAVNWFVGNFAPLMVFSVIGVFHSFDLRRNYLTVNLMAWIILALFVILAQRLSWWEYHFMLFFVPLGVLGVRGLDALWLHLRLLQSPLAHRNSLVACSIVLLFLPSVTNLGMRGLLLARHGLATDENRLRKYQSSVSPEYQTVLKEVAFLRDSASLPGDIYVFGGSDLYYYLSGRDPAIPILARSFCPPELWAQLQKSLQHARPSYIFVPKDRVKELREHTPKAAPYIDAAARFVYSNYTAARRSDAGTWYVATNFGEPYPDADRQSMFSKQALPARSLPDSPSWGPRTAVIHRTARLKVLRHELASQKFSAAESNGQNVRLF